MDKNKKFINTVFLLILGAFACAPLLFNYYGSIQVFGQDYTENDEIKDLNQQIQDKKNSIKKIQNKQEAYVRAIQQKQEEKISLNNELSILDNRMAKFELDIESTKTNLERINLEIKKINVQIEDMKKEIEKEKGQIAVALKLIYKEDVTSALEILLLNDSLSEFLNQAKYLSDVNEEIGRSLDLLKEHKTALENNKLSLDQKNKETIALKATLEEQKKTLEMEKENKGYLLEQTNSSEKQFQRLLEQARQEQQQAANEISSVERTIREKMSKLDAERLEFNDNGFVWPVPKNTITAFFHDPDYPFRYVFEHPAIDIRAGQGTQLRAAASGYVAKIKNGGATGYSYIMLIHGDGLSTVYGHVSKIYVQEDDYVTQGQVIGLTGGLPGTSGAGRMTTGPHLHFETRFNGLPVDPLNYMP